MSGRLVLGITGGIASGKTAVMQHLKRLGVPTISSDDLAHLCIRRGQPAYRKVLRHFGPAIRRVDGEIDRPALGRIVFSNTRERKYLEHVVHPCVIRGLKRFVRQHKGLIALEIPLLFEAHLEAMVDRVVVVFSTRAQQMSRLRAREHLSAAEASRRLGIQMPLSMKRRRADVVLGNTGSLKGLRQQIKNLKKNLTRN